MGRPLKCPSQCELFLFVHLARAAAHAIAPRHLEVALVTQGKPDFRGALTVHSFTS